MSDLDGLNLAELLDRMESLVLPPPVAYLPATTGWWIVAAFLLLVAVAIGWRAWRSFRRNAYRRAALRDLAAIELAWKETGTEAAAEIAAVVRRAALVVYPRGEIAKLYGSEWADFLAQSCRADDQLKTDIELIATSVWRGGETEELPRMLGAARCWVRAHRA